MKGMVECIIFPYSLHSDFDNGFSLDWLGKRIEQGAAVGRVERELTFEITKEDAPINPLDVITGG